MAVVQASFTLLFPLQSRFSVRTLSAGSMCALMFLLDSQHGNLVHNPPDSLPDSPAHNPLGSRPDNPLRNLRGNPQVSLHPDHPDSQVGSPHRNRAVSLPIVRRILLVPQRDIPVGNPPLNRAVCPPTLQASLPEVPHINLRVNLLAHLRASLRRSHRGCRRLNQPGSRRRSRPVSQRGSPQGNLR